MNSNSELYTLHAWEDNQVRLKCTQGEGGIKIAQFALVDKDGAVDLTDALQIVFNGEKSDGSACCIECDLTNLSADNKQNGLVNFVLKTGMTDISGNVKVTIQVITSTGNIKFDGVTLYVKPNSVEELIEASEPYQALVEALRRLGLITPEGTIVLDDLLNGNLRDGINPVASGNLKTFLEGNFQTYLKNRYMSFKYAHVAHSNTYDADTNPVDSYNDSPFEGVYIDEATNPMTFYIIKGGNGVQTGILLCAKAVGSSNNGVTQIALYYHGGFQYRRKSNSTNEWTEWAGIEIQTNRDVYNSADSKYYGVTNNSSRYPSSKMIYRLINKVYSLFKDSVVLNYDGLETDITFNIHSDLVETYLNDSDYSNDLDYSISKLDDSSFNSYKSNADFKFSNEESHGRPNKEIIPVPSGGVKIVYKDTVSGLEWSESVTSSITYIQNLIPNRIYTYKVLSTDGTVLNSGTAKATGKVRMINAGGQTYNIRDIGGWAADGGILRYGVIYRGAELNGDNVSIDANQQAFFKNILGIRDEIDLRENNRNGIGNTALGIGVDYLHVPIIYPPNFLINDLDRCSKVIKRIAKDISENKPIYIHCGAGADRTGVTCFLIEAMCGVSQNDIDRDYELTSFSTQPADSNNVETLIRARNSSWGYGLKQWISTINNHQSMDGSSFHDKVIRILLRAGVTIDEINTIRFGLIEGNPTKLSNPYSNVTITKSLTRVSIDNTDTSIAMYQPYEATLIASNTNYFDSNSVSITMNGNPNFSYSFINLKTTCKIKIPKVLGDIVITAVASPTTYLSNVSTNNIDNDAITTEKIVNGAVTENKLSFTAVKYIVAATLPSVDNANADTDYYIGTAASGYVHYRLINGVFVPLGTNSYSKTDSYSKSEIDALLKQKTNVMPWGDVQAAVRRGQAEKLFPIGYEFEVNKNGGGTIPFVVLGYDTIAPQDTDLTHSMILGTKYIFGRGNRDYTPIQFDAPEALTYAANLVGERTYLFNWTGSSNMDSGNWFCYIPSNMNGLYQIVLNEEDRTLSFYLMSKGVLSSTAAQTLPITQSSFGTDIVGFTNVNDINRVLYGSNNYAQSAVRQLLNSSASSGNVWIPKTVFDRPPAWADTLSGFMSNIDDSEFMQVVATASVPCRTNDLFEVDNLDGTHFSTSSTYTVNDKFFLLSLPEISGGWDNANIKDGEQLDYYVGATQIDYIKYDKNGTPRYSFLRSPHTASGTTTTQSAYCVDSSSGISVSRVWNAYGIAPACIIA